MQTKIIETEAELAALAEPWRTLAERSGARPFQDFGWSSAWLRTFGAAGGYQVRVATLWDDTRLVTVLPLAVRRLKGVRVLEWLGEQVTDYCDAIVDPAVDARASLAHLWDELNRRGGFDLVRLKHVRADARVSDLVDRLNPWVETTGAAYGIPIDCPTGKDWLERLPARRRERLSYNLRRMGRMGFEFSIWQPPAPLEPIVATLLEQKRSWLAAQGLGGPLQQEPAGQFLRLLAKEMAGRGLHLSVIRSQDAIAACHLGFLRNGVLYSYMPSYDLSLQKYSLGNVLRETLIMWACDNGVRRFDLLLGDEEYKTQYESCTREPVRTLVIPRGLLGRAAVSVYRVGARHRGRRLEGERQPGGVSIADSAAD
ncbi:MAG TPA: GNAT family N-acetyltransferase [Steroidobacteraceae bacterium]|nr:GNAT family N-acetyltransferase [Steroidobacteraceae bacterium]